MKKILVFGMMLVFLIALRSNANGAPSTVYVDDDWAGLPNGTVVSGHIIGTDAFASIQDAVNAVASGGTVYVWNGTYNENIDVTKSVSIIGNESASCIVKAADNADSVFWVNADQVTISGLNITGGSRGVLLRSDTDYCNVSNNILYNNGWGIGVFGIIGGSTTLSYMADHNVIMNNTISHNEEGIWMYKAQYNKIKGNIISYNTNRGIHMDTYSRYNLIINNYIRNNQYGIRIEDSTPTSIDNQIYNNCIYHNTYNANDTCSNIWSISKTAGPNIVGGPWLGGNYWGDYVGTDVDGDGIGDTPYTIPDGDNQDQFPLTTSISNVNKNKYYLTIQDAIDDANDGEIVVVHDGVYRENVNIDKSITLKNGSKPVIDGMGDIAINITANNVTIEGFNITNSSCGIKCITSGLHILNNTLYNCSYGIVLLHSDHNYVYNNNISGVIAEDACGIYLDYVNDSTFINNSIFDYRMVTGSACGIYLGYSSNNTFDGVYIHKLDLAVQVDYGIYMKEANNNALEGIEICDLHGEYGYGIYIQNSDNNTFNDSYIHDIDSTEGYAFYSDEWGSNNSIYNMTVASYLTTISFTYGNGIALNGVDNPHSSTMASIRKYVEIYNMTTNSWINLTINYTDDDAYGVTEETIGLYHWNETTETWEEVEANLDTTRTE
ncbi:MAG: right-handed parallel beta-helix repeat-containing protein [Thermoplasmata archaeon]|nr:right-handed parallel beta-helix repeat-containing protein [Thermoplasmata archaeon]